jgi:O-antigen ligase
VDLINQHQASSAQWSVRQAGILRSFSEDRWVLAAQLLMLLNLVAMTRAFALVSLIEFLLWCLFLFYSPLRAALLESFSDIRIKMVFAFWGWVAIATLWSPADFGLRFEEVWSWRKLLLFPMAWVLFRDPRLKRAAVFTLIVTAGIYMFFSWAGYLGYVSLDRAPSQLLENHTTQGVVFASMSLLMLIMMKTDTLPMWVKLVFCLLIAGMVTNIVYVLTGRTAYVALLLLAPYGAWLVASRLRWLSAAVVLVVISLALYNSDTAKSRVAQGLNEFGTTISGEAESYTSMGIRWVYWENTLRMIAANPILGSGSGGFSEDYAHIVADDAGWRATVTDDPHQQYLLIAGEQGLVGLALFLAVLVAMLISCGDDSNRLGALGILMMTALNGMFNGHFGSFVEGRLFWIMMGVLLSSTLPLKSVGDLKYASSEFLSALGKAVGVKVYGK